jgi:hypothetical protein
VARQAARRQKVRDFGVFARELAGFFDFGAIFRAS